MRNTVRTFIAILVLASVAGCGGKEIKNLNEEERAADQAAAASIPAPAQAAEAVFDVPLTKEAALAGNTIYQKMCAPCHGTGGKGDGVASAALNPKPRDHTNGSYMDKLTNEHLHQVITQGGAKFGYPTMPALSQLSDDDVRNVIAFVRSLSPTYKP